MPVTGSFTTFINQLNENLQQPLPGESAHQVMNALPVRWQHVHPDEHTRKSAVLVLFYPYMEEIYFPLILRPVYDGAHSGQVAFPGGRYELSDKDLIRTALREAHEEIGVHPAAVTIIGTLTELFIPASNFMVLPVIGYITQRPEFKPDAREVAQILEVNYRHIADPGILKSGEILVRGEQLTVPLYEIEGHKIWGATAKMITELLLVINTPPKIQN